MTDDGDTPEPEQRRAPVLGVVKTLLEILESTSRQQESRLAGEGGGQGLFEQGTNGFHQSLADLERHVADKAIADDDVGAPVVEVAALDIAQEVERKLFDQLKRVKMERK